MNHKKMFAGVLAVILSAAAILPSQALNEAAEEEVDMADSAEFVEPGGSNAAAKDYTPELEAAILLAKTRVDIPEEYSNFNFYSNKGADGKTRYSLEWQRDRTDGYAYISVSVAGKIITSYNKYDDGDSYDVKGFAKLSKNALYSKAKAALKTIDPDIAGKYTLDKDSYNSHVGSQNASFGFQRYANGVPVTGQSGSISLNKDTGELKNFRVNYTDGLKFQSPKTALTSDGAKQAFIKAVGYSPVYVIKDEYDYTTEKRTTGAFLVYQPNGYDYINAFTGKIDNPTPDEYGYDDGADFDVTEEAMADNAAGNAKAAPTLTPQEIAAVEVEKGLLKPQDLAKALIADEYNSLTSKYTLTNYRLTTDYNDKTHYTWNLTLKDNSVDYYTTAAAKVDAKTGKLISFSHYLDNYNKAGKSAAVAEADVPADMDMKANAALVHFLGADIAAKYDITKSSLEQGGYSTAKERLYSGKYYTFTRMYRFDGDEKTSDAKAVTIPVISDTINLHIDLDGKVTSYTAPVYTDVKLPSPAKMLSAADLGKAYVKNGSVKLEYIVTQSKDGVFSTKLLYSNTTGNLGAFSGKPVDYDGGDIIYDESAKIGNYTDIMPETFAKMIGILADNGIALTAIDGKLSPNTAITESDFINLLDQCVNDGNQIFNQDYLYRTWNNASVLKPSLTRAEAAKAFVTAFGGAKIAAIPGLFTSPYKDVKNTDPNVGYLAILSAVGAWNAYPGTAAQSPDYAYPNKDLSRIDALLMVYNYLK